MRWGLTKDQQKELTKKSEDLTAAALRGERHFGLSNWQCKEYLNISNETLHEPMCYVKEVDGDKVYVEATFLGSGIMSHPVRRGWIPKEAVRVDVSGSIFFKLVCNFFMSFFKDLDFVNYDRKELERRLNALNMIMEGAESLIVTYQESLNISTSILLDKQKNLETYKEYLRKDVERGDCTENSQNLINLQLSGIERISARIADLNESISREQAEIDTMQAEIDEIKEKLAEEQE